MAMIELSFSLNLNPTCPASEVRVWVDLEPEQGLSSEVEVPLWPAGDDQWRGMFSVDAARRADFAYRLGVYAHDGAQWSLSFRQCGTDAELLSDTDRLVGSKCWLVGSCPVTPQPQCVAPQPSALAAGDKRRRAVPRLRLIRGGAD